MSEQITISTILSMLAEEEMEHMADYVRRDRPLSAVPLDRLKRDWIDEFRVFMREPGEINGRLEDVEAEIKLRGADLPREAICREVKHFAEEYLARAWALPMTEKTRINDLLTRDLQRHLDARGPGH